MKLLIALLTAAAAHADFKENLMGDVFRYERRVPIDLSWCEANLFGEGGGFSCELGGNRNDSDLIGGKIGFVQQAVLFLKTSEHCNTLYTAYPEGYKLQMFDYDHAGSLSREQSIACLNEAAAQLPPDAVTKIDRTTTEKPVPPANEVLIGKVGSVLDITMQYSPEWRNRLEVDSGSLQDRGEYAERGGKMTLRTFSGGTDLLVQYDHLDEGSAIGESRCTVNVYPSIQLNNGTRCELPASASCRGFVAYDVDVRVEQSWDGLKPATIPSEADVRACLDRHFNSKTSLHATVLRYF